MKLLLTVQSGSLAGKTYQLNEGFLTVGRGENCAVRFDPLTERIASKQHAYIEAKPDGFYLTDNQSSNGTLLNNQKIQSAKLNSGDRIQFGKNGVEAVINLQTEAFNSEPTQIKPDFQPANQTPQSPPVNWKNSISGFGVSRLQAPVQPSQTGKYVGAAAAIFSVVFLSLIVMLLMFASVGIGAAVVEDQGTDLVVNIDVDVLGELIPASEEDVIESFAHWHKKANAVAGPAEPAMIRRSHGKAAGSIRDRHVIGVVFRFGDVSSGGAGEQRTGNCHGQE